MTNREFFVAVQEAAISEELTAKAVELIEALDKRNDKRKSTESKEKKAAAERKQKVLDFLKNNEGVFTREEIAKGCDFITAGQVTAACTALVKENVVEKCEVKIDKARKTAYRVKNDND